MSEVDLHVHSTASDGKFSPVEIVHKAVKHGLTVIALADHDTVGGVTPAINAAKVFTQLLVIPCVEISVDAPGDEVHFLGYFVDYTNSEFIAKLDNMRHSRRERAQKMISKLSRLGINIDWQRVQEIADGGAIGRPHLAQAMLEKGYITSLKEAFIKYISRGGSAYVEREKMTAVEAVELILMASGLPVLAHPFTVGNPETLVAKLKNVGLVGIEAYYNGYTADSINQLLNLADKYELVSTGGSDYHGLDDSVETMIGGTETPMESAERLITLAK